MDIKVTFDNITVKEDKIDTVVKILMLKGEKGDQGDGENNVIEEVQVNGTALPVSNKAVNVPVPTVDNALNSTSENPVQNKVIYNALGNKVDTTELENYYEINQVDDLLNNKADISLLSTKANISDIQTNYETIANHNNDISRLTAQISSLANGSPLVASSTSEMTNTDKVYVNTSDGKWYYYDESNWVEGGTYQSTGIADKSIDVLMLNDPLQSNFNKDYIKIVPENAWDVYYYVNNNAVAQNNGNGGYSSYLVNLEKGKTYLFSGFNRYSANGLIIVNSSSQVVYSSLTNSSIVEGTSLIFHVNDTGMRAYISRTNGNNYPWEYQQTMLCELTDVYNNIKIKTSLEISSTLENYYIRGDRISINGFLSYLGGNNYNINVYRISKGLTYKITSGDLWYIPAYVITDLSYMIKENSYTEYKANLTPVSYTFTAEFDGYVFLPNINTSNQLIGEIEIVYNTIEVKNISDNLYGKKVLWNGDSICYGAGNGGVSYCDMIANTYNMNSTKYAVSGRCIAKEDGETSILETISSMDNTADYVIFEGGWNDMWRVALGTISEGYNDTLDEYTWSGALESLIKQSKIKWPTAKIGFILAHGKANNESEITRQNTYWDRAIEVFNKWHLPYIDLRHNGLVAFNDTLLDMFFQISSTTSHGDGTHPNALGYRTFYNTPIANWMNSL